MMKHFVLFTTLFLLAGSITLKAQERTFSYQGVLLDAAKQPIFGTHSLLIKIYDAPEGGEVLHEERFTPNVENGVFSVLIGSQVAFGASVAFEKQYWLGISVDGGEEMSPRTAVTSVPNALHSQAASSLIKGATGAVTSLNGASGDLEFKGGPGTIVETDGKTITITSMPIGNQEPQAANWSETGGNAAGANSYVGTNNNTVLRMQVKSGTTINNSVILNNNWSLQRDAGGNARGTDAVDLQRDRNANSQVASGNNSVIGGGERNTSTGDWSATAGGYENEADANYAAIGGGFNNRVTAQLSTIAGGSSNLVTGQYASVGGGRRNAATADYAFVGGGFEDTASGTYATIGGGNDNKASGFASTVSGGNDNQTSDYYASVGGGQNNVASGYGATISGGTANVASGSYASVGGGSTNIAAGARSTIPGGYELHFTHLADRSFGFNANTAIGSAPMTISEKNVAVFGNADLWLANTDNTASELRFYEPQNTFPNFPASSTHYAAIKAPVLAGDYTLTLPTNDGSANQVLSTDGSGILSWVDAGPIDWHQAGGNEADASSYVGTNNNTSLRLQVRDGETINNTVILNSNGSIQRDEEGDARGIHAVDLQTVRSATAQVASGDYSVVAGGRENKASGLGSFVGGGGWDGTDYVEGDPYYGKGPNGAIGINSAVVGGWDNFANGDWSSVGAGWSNYANANSSTIAGGGENTADGDFSTIGGGANNTVSAPFANISGGHFNAANGHFTTIGGGYLNTTGDTYATVSGGQGNTASGGSSTISGGTGNTASDYYATIGGGNDNTASGFRSTIGGGIVNNATGGESTVGGGHNNTASGQYTTVGGGFNNTASYSYAAVGGGYINTASYQAATVGGGFLNTASGARATISGGLSNAVSGDQSSIGGGANNTISGKYSAIPGGRALVLNGDRSFGFNSNNAAGTADMSISATNTTVFGNANLWLANTDNAARELRFYEAQSTAGAFPAAATNYTAFKAQAQAGDITYTLPAADGTNGQLLSTNGSGVLSWATVTSPTDWHETGGNAAGASSYIGTNNSAILRMQVRNGATINNSLVLNTNSSMQRDEAGNARGTGAVDLQIERLTAAQVASGYASTIAGGFRNEASGAVSVIGGGSSNTASESHATVGGGAGNVVSGSGATIGGGIQNTANATYATVAGGGGNTAGSSATIGGGYHNNATNPYAVISGGSENTVSGSFSVIAGGVSNLVSGETSTIAGGNAMTLSGPRSFGFNANNAAWTAPMSISASNAVVFGNANLWLANTDNTAHELRFYEAQSTTGAFPAATTNYTAFKAGTQAANVTYTLPGSDGTSGQMLTTNGAGVLSWSTASGPNDWHVTGGNAADASSFIGTNNNSPLRMQVKNGATIMNGLVMTASGSLQRDESGDARGTNATDLQRNRSVAAQVASGSHSVLGGGFANRADGSTSVVSGGQGNRASGTFGVVSGGNTNMASAQDAVVGGGSANLAEGIGASVGGGHGNTAHSDYSTVQGGDNNNSYGSYSTISGGQHNSTNDDYTAIGGGYENLAYTDGSAIGGGYYNTAEGFYSAIGGGYTNTTRAFGATIGGGALNRSSQTFATVAGGSGNIDSGYASTIAGGYENSSFGDYAAIAGGAANVADGEFSAIPGGRGLTLSAAADNTFGFNGSNSADMIVSSPNTAVIGNANVWLANTDGTPRELRFYEAQSGNNAFPATGTNYTAFKAQTQATHITYTLPSALPTANGVLVTTNTGTLAWASHGRVAASNGTTHTINDAAVTGSNTILVTIEGAVTAYAVTARNAGTSFTITTAVALTTSDVINYQILP